jgi:hypothetical protein
MDTSGMEHSCNQTLLSAVCLVTISHSLEIAHEKRDEKLVVPIKFEYIGGQISCDSYVIPGVYEMLQYVKIGKGQQMAFFSAGVKERNEALVPLLLKNAFPDDHERILSESPIFSRHHQKGTNRKDLQLVADHYKKSLKKPIPLDDILLIDDYPRIVAKGQNALSVYPPVRNLRPNRIFYTTGVLDALFSSSMTTPEFLTRHHETYFQREVDTKMIEKFMQKGLELLQGCNHKLKLAKRAKRW